MVMMEKILMINLNESIKRKNLYNLGVLILLLTFIGYLPFFTITIAYGG